jgi:hypothetical protein
MPSDHSVEILWRFSVAIAATAVASELLPLVFGVGKNARWDWGFVYATVHFLLLPVAAVAHLVTAIWCTAALAGSGRLRSALLAAASCVFPAGYLAVLYLHPLFWFVSA